MCYCDKNNVKLFIGDMVIKDGQKYIIKFIEEYSFVTVAIAENINTRNIETLLLQDITKL